MGIHNYAFNNLDAKLSNDSYWDFFLSSDQRDFNQEVIYSTEIMNYSAQTSLFGSSFYSTRLPVYIVGSLSVERMLIEQKEIITFILIVQNLDLFKLLIFHQQCKGTLTIIVKVII